MAVKTPHYLVHLPHSYHRWCSIRSIHSSTPSLHHLPRDPNIPYNRHRSLPLFPDFWKKTMEKMREPKARLSKVWEKFVSFELKEYYKSTTMIVGNAIAIYGIYKFEKTKKIEEGRKKEVKEIEERRKKEFEELKKNMDVILAEVRKERKNTSEDKEKVMEVLSKMSDIQILEKYKVVKKLVETEDLMLLFLAASNDERKTIVQAILKGDL